MKRTNSTLPLDIQNYSELVQRMTLARLLGTSYNGDRDLYDILGYSKDITTEQYKLKYKRQDIAKAIIERPVKATWRGSLSVLESHDAEETEFEKKWKELESKLSLRRNFGRLDRLVGLSRYAVLLVCFSDVISIEAWAVPLPATGALDIIYIKPIGDTGASVLSWETNSASSRYGLPLTYTVQIEGKDKQGGISIVVHYSRVLHVVEDPVESEVFGTPRLEAVFNRLEDLEKIVGGSAEMYWRGARPGYQGKIDEGYTITPKQTEELKAQISEYEHNLRRIFVNQGVDLKALEAQVSDPKSHVDVQIEMISAATNIPRRILTGSERGELASSQDKEHWLEFISDRREEFAEPQIVRPFIELCQKVKLLPETPEGYSVQWANLFSVTEQDSANLGKTRATALKEYASTPEAWSIVPPDAFFEFFLGLTPDQIELITKMKEAAMYGEENEMREALQFEEETE